MTKSTSRSRSTLFAFTAILLLLLILELILRAVVSLSVDYLSRRQDLTYDYKLWQMHLFDTFMGMHEPDPELFWKLKPGYEDGFVKVNSDGYAGEEIAPKQAGEYRILFLGDSTPFGLGLPREQLSFVHQLEDSLQQRVKDRNISVINASVSGYSSWQCRKRLELSGDDINPDMVVCYFGNNDPSINGYISDQELYEQTSRAGWLNRILAHSYIYLLLKDIVLGLKPEPVRESLVLSERVPLQQAKENLEHIKRWCEQRSVELMLCGVATPDLWPPGIQFKVFAGGRDEGGRLVMASEMQNDLKSSWALCLDTLLLPGQSDEWTRRVYESAYRDLGDPQRVVELYEDQLDQSPTDVRVLNNLAVARWYAGEQPDSLLDLVISLAPGNPVPLYNRGIVEYRKNRVAAEVYLDSAKQLDNYSLRIKRDYNDLYAAFASENPTPIARVDSLLEGLPETDYFVDHCHPTLQGHRLVADYLSDVISRSLRSTK